MSGTDAAVEVLGEALQAYKQRVAELEKIVAVQQAKIAELEKSPNDKSEEMRVAP